MARPQLSPLDRLSHSIWIRAALARYLDEIRAGTLTPKQPVPTTGKLWAWFEREVIGSTGPSDPLTVGAGVLVSGVVNNGSEPRWAKRLIPFDEVQDHGPFEGCEIVRRRPSGKSASGQALIRSEIPYYEIPIDLVAAVEVLLPGSSAWESAFLWTLSGPECLPLEVIRRQVSRLLHDLKLCRPSIEERRHYLDPDIFAATTPETAEAQEELYRASLLPLAQNVSAQSMSLLAALCAESWLADDDVLFVLHTDAFENAMNAYFVGPILGEVRNTFFKLVGLRVLDGYRDERDPPLPSELCRPLISMEDWDQRTARQWTPVPEF